MAFSSILVRKVARATLVPITLLGCFLACSSLESNGSRTTGGPSTSPDSASSEGGPILAERDAGGPEQDAARESDAARHEDAALDSGPALDGGGPLLFGDAGERSCPSPHSFVGPAVKMASTDKGGCAITSAGKLYCWGGNFYGQLGIGVPGTALKASTPVEVPLPGNVVDVAVADSYKCALIQNGDAYCWGDGYAGELGGGVVQNSSVPKKVLLSGPAASIESGTWSSCALLRSGSVQCWGSNVYRQLGDGTTVAERATPSTVVGVTGASRISLTHYSACAIVAGGAKCWGLNNLGQLGDGTQVDRNVAVSVAQLGGVPTSISAGTGHTCAMVGGTPKCWGYNTSGELGDGTNVTSLTPVPVVLAAGDVAKDVVAGFYGSCVILTNGAAKCWGGRVADGHDGANTLKPELKWPAGPIASITPHFTTCSLSVSGEIACALGQDNFPTSELSLGSLGPGTVAPTGVCRFFR